MSKYLSPVFIADKGHNTDYFVDVLGAVMN